MKNHLFSIAHRFCLAALITVLGFAYTEGQIPPSNQGSSFIVTPISLDSMQSVTFDVSINPNSILYLKFEPDKSTLEALKKVGLMNKETRLMTTPNMEPDLTLLHEKRTGKLLNVSVKAGTAIFNAKADEDQFVYAIEVTQTTLPKNGKLVIKNITRISIKGQVKYAWRSIANQKSMEADEISLKVNKSFEQVKNTDMLYLMEVIFDRYLNNFPGGKGEVDEIFEYNLQIAGVSRSTIQTLSVNLKKYQDRISQKVSNKNLLNIKMQTKLDKGTIRQMNFLPPSVTSEPKTTSESSFLGHYKHSLAFWGIKSHRCADDEGWEWDCDQEEGYVGYYCVGPNMFKTGYKDFSGMVKGSERFLYQPVFSNERMRTPFILLYQVVEDDSGGPSRNEMLGAISAGFYTVISAYSGNILSAITYGYDFLVSTVTIIQSITAGPDDDFPIYMNLIDEIRLKEYTLGTTPPPQDRSLFESEGSYRGNYTIRVPKIMSNERLQWSLVYILNGIPINYPIAELYADANYTGAKKQLFIDGSFIMADLAPVSDNSISSIKLLDPNYEVVLFDNSNQTGTDKVIRQEYPNLSTLGFDNRTSSVLIRKRTDYVYRDLTVISGNSANINPPNGYEKLNYDLNATAGGAHIYLCYRKGTESELRSAGIKPISEIRVIEGKNTPTPNGYTKINVDLNQGAGGSYLYLCYKRGEFQEAIKDITVIQGRSSSIEPPDKQHYTKVNVDLNKGAGGDFLFFCHSKIVYGTVLSNVIL